MRGKKIYLRVDGNRQIGLGHLVRCIALAQMLHEHFSLHFFCKEIPESLEDEIKRLGFPLSKISDENEFLHYLDGDEVVVLDNYFFDSNYQKKIKERVNMLICIDDLCDKEFYSDLIINVSPNIKPSDYHAQAYTRFAFGIHYALLRPAFLANSGSNKSVPNRNNLLICLGGSDSNNMTQEILRLLKDQYKGVINLVVGVSYPFLNQLRDFVEENKLSKNVYIHCDINEYELVGIMKNCGIAICSPSTISIEYLAVSKGLLLLLLTADNQSKWFDYAISEKLGFDFSKISFERMGELETNHLLQDQLFDGAQRARFLELLK